MDPDLERFPLRNHHLGTQNAKNFAPSARFHPVNSSKFPPVVSTDSSTFTELTRLTFDELECNFATKFVPGILRPNAGYGRRLKPRVRRNCSLSYLFGIVLFNQNLLWLELGWRRSRYLTVDTLCYRKLRLPRYMKG